MPKYLWLKSKLHSCQHTSQKVLDVTHGTSILDCAFGLDQHTSDLGIRGFKSVVLRIVWMSQDVIRKHFQSLQLGAS